MSFAKALVDRRCEVIWVDSCSRDAWTEDVIRAPGRICTVGYVVKETPTFIALAQSIGGNQVAAQIAIPKSCIVSKRYWKRT